MARAEHSVMIRRRPHELFAFLTDPDDTPMWQATVSEVARLGDGSVAVGGRFVEEVAVGLRTTVVSTVQAPSGGVWLPTSGVRAWGGTR